MEDQLKQLGKWLMILGIAGLVVTVIFNMTPGLRPYDKGALPAISFFFILLAMAFLYPDMLQDGSKSLSTMRVVVFMTISVFTIIAIKIGWVAPNYDDFRIDRTWVYILGLVFGSKLFQNYTEGLDHGTKQMVKPDTDKP